MCGDYTQTALFAPRRAAEEITGCRTDNALRMTIWQMFPDMLPKIGPGRFEIRTSRQDGRMVNLRFSVSSVMIDENNIAGYVWGFADVTELRALERQMRQKESVRIRELRRVHGDASGK